MAILFSGDFHNNSIGELETITKEALVEKYQRKKYDSIQYHIMLGDCGFMWPGNRNTDLSNCRALARRPFPILCVVGNHEPILGMSGLQETDIGIGETVYQIQDKPFVAYLKRGKVYTIDGFTILALGGALSIDKSWRIPNVTWWKQEYWSTQEKRDIFKLLKKENTFDFVISHTGPHSINEALFLHEDVYVTKFIDEVAYLNDKIREQIQFHEWWNGHWHRDRYYYNQETARGYQYLYRTTKIAERLDDTIVVHNELGLQKR